MTNIKMMELLSNIKLILRNDLEIEYFCRDKKIAEILKQKYKEIKRSNRSELELESTLIKYEEFIDMEKLLVISYRNYRDSLEYVEENKESVVKEEHVSMDLINKEQELKRHNIKELKYLLRNSKITLPYVYSNKDYSTVKVLDMQEDSKKNKERKKENKRIIKKLSNVLKDKQENPNKKGLIYLIQFLKPEDIANEIFIIQDIHRSLFDAVSVNLTKEDMHDGETLFYEVANQMTNICEYIDFNKLFNIVLYRIQTILEIGNYDIENIDVLEYITRHIMKFLPKDSKCEFSTKDENTNLVEKIQYTYEDIEKLYSGFIETKEGIIYLSDEQKEKIKQDLINQEYDVDKININTLSSLNLTNEETIKIMSINNANFALMLEFLELSEEKIAACLTYIGNCNYELLEYLYENKEISTETIKHLWLNNIISEDSMMEFCEKNNKEFITANEIFNDYEELKIYKEKDRPDKVKKLEKKIELYKNINIKDKTEEEKQAAYDDFIYSTIENFDEQNEDIIFFNKVGLVPLETLVEWSGQDILFNTEVETRLEISDLEELLKKGKITPEFLEHFILKEISNPQIEYETKKQYILKGYISEEAIFKLFEEGKIFEKDLKEFAEKGLVSQEKSNDIVLNQTKEKLEENSKIKLVLVNIPDKITTERYNISTNNPSNVTGKKVILPAVRKRLFSMLGAVPAKALVGEDSAFYNYEFYVIPDEKGNIGINSVVIAERFFNNKEAEDKLAVDNATYFFKYKDLMVNSNLSKKDMEKEKSGIIFRAFHKKCAWAKNILNKIVETRLSSNLQEYSPKNRRKIYTDTLWRMYTKKRYIWNR